MRQNFIIFVRLEIVSLQGVQFDGEISSLNLRTASGEITVLDNHRPLITQLSRGEAIVIKENGEKINFDINSGFLEVSDDNRATILSS
jgi:F0F1-type ATP synthase epsilon subunit